MRNKEYFVVGDYGYETEEVLFESDSLDEALRWAADYARHGDLGGYLMVEVAYYSEEGEFITEETYRAEAMAL